MTDGGAVENRGIISVLLALVEALETLQKRGQVLALPEIIIIVAVTTGENPVNAYARMSTVRLQVSRQKNRSGDGWKVF
mgnify:CR=1 FL=1